MRVGKKLLKMAETADGTFTRRSLEVLGIPWPPPEGWKDEVTGQPISQDDARRFVMGKLAQKES